MVTKNWMDFNHRNKNHGFQNCGFVTVSSTSVISFKVSEPLEVFQTFFVISQIIKIAEAVNNFR